MPPPNIIDIYRSQGWNDMAAIQADIAAGHWREKVGSGGGGVPTFDFDYTGEATKAYGELGAYYERLWNEASGDLNKVLARLTEDYDKGLRVKTRDTALADESYALAQAEQNRQQGIANNRLEGNLINRGLFSQSAYAPGTGPTPLGIGSALVNNLNDPYAYRTEARNRQRLALKTGLADYEGLYGPTGTLRKRAQEDAATNLSRKQFQLEQSRREQAGSIADQRATRAYNQMLAERSVF